MGVSWWRSRAGDCQWHEWWPVGNIGLVSLGDAGGKCHQETQTLEYIAEENQKWVVVKCWFCSKTFSTLLPSLARVLLLYSGRSSRVGLKQEREKVAHQVASSRKRHTGVRRACAQTIPWCFLREIPPRPCLPLPHHTRLCPLRTATLAYSYGDH